MIAILYLICHDLVMKKIQFALSEEKYNKAKKLIKDHDLTWQTICEQMVDHVIMTENLDEYGLPIQEMSPSVYKHALSGLEGHLEAAAWKYIQIIHEVSGRNRPHWLGALRGALKHVIKSNTRKTMKRGYVFNDDKLNDILNEMWPNAMMLAADHLEVDAKDFKIKKPTVKELFDFAEVEYPYV